MSYLLDKLKNRLEIEVTDTDKDYILTESINFAKGILLNECNINTFGLYSKLVETVPVNGKVYTRNFPLLSVDSLSIDGLTNLIADTAYEWLSTKKVIGYPTGGFTDVTLNYTNADVVKFTCIGENSDGNNEWEVLSYNNGKLNNAISNESYSTDYFTLTIKDDSDNKFQKGDLLFLNVRKSGAYFPFYYKNELLNPLYSYQVEYIYGYAFDEQLETDLEALILNLANYYFTKANMQSDSMSSFGNQMGDDIKQIILSLPVHLKMALDQHRKVVI